MWRRGERIKGREVKREEEKNRKKSGPPMETSRLMTILEEGCWLVVDESRLSCSRGPVQRIDGPKKEIGICRLPPSGENWIRADRF